jgi:hypothetical protein
VCPYDAQSTAIGSHDARPLSWTHQPSTWSSSLQYFWYAHAHGFTLACIGCDTHGLNLDAREDLDLLHIREATRLNALPER